MINHDIHWQRPAGNREHDHRVRAGKLRPWLGLVGLSVLFTACAESNPSPPPSVTRVEPPGWWAGHSHNPVRVLFTGEHLTGARVEVPTGFKADRLAISADGRYLFADLHVPTNTTTGDITLRLQNAAGETTSTFTLLPRPARPGNFQGFGPDDVIYLAMIDRFANGDPTNDNPAAAAGLHDRSKARYYHGGDLRGVIQRLDYLRDLGVTTLWLTPWYDNANQLNRREKYTRDNRLSAQGEPITDYHGYGAVDFYAVEEHFGDLQLLRELVVQAHARGLKVVQDQVANHTGPYHPWVNHPPTPTWFNGTASDHLENTWQTWTTAATNPPPDKLRSTLEGWFINILPDLNQNDPETSTYLIQNSLWWVGVTGLDAIRQDTLPYVPRSYWSRWTAAIKREHPQLTILGEMWDGDPKLVSFFQGGRPRFDGVDSGVDTLFDFPLYHAIRDVFVRQAPMTRLPATLAADTNYVNPAALLPFLGLHDVGRFLGEPGATPEGLKLAFTFLLTTRGTPLIYYGDEIGMRGGGDPDNRRDFPGGWPGDSRNAFNFAGRTPEEAAIHAHVKKLLALRRELEPLRRGAVAELTATHDTYAFARTTAKNSDFVAINNSPQPRRFDLAMPSVWATRPRELTDRLGELGKVQFAGGRCVFTLPAKTAAILTASPTDIAAGSANEASP